MKNPADFIQKWQDFIHFLLIFEQKAVPLLNLK